MSAVRERIAAMAPRRIPASPPKKQYREEARELEATLKARLQGEVRFDTGSRAAYATDHSIYRAVPVGVVIPRDVGDVIATVEACHARGVPVLPRAAGRACRGRPATWRSLSTFPNT